MVLKISGGYLLWGSTPSICRTIAWLHVSIVFIWAFEIKIITSFDIQWLRLYIFLFLSELPPTAGRWGYLRARKYKFGVTGNLQRGLCLVDFFRPIIERVWVYDKLFGFRNDPRVWLYTPAILSVTGCIYSAKLDGRCFIFFSGVSLFVEIIFIFYEALRFEWTWKNLYALRFKWFLKKI